MSRKENVALIFFARFFFHLYTTFIMTSSYSITKNKEHMKTKTN